MIAPLLLAITAASIIDSAKADAKAVGFKDADTCAYAPFLIGGGSPDSRTASLIDTQEVDDRSGRVVGYYYVDSKGDRYLQATAFMDLATIERLGFRFQAGDLVSDARPYDGHDIGLIIKSCRPQHVMSNLVIKDLGREMKAAFYSGLDVLPPSRRAFYINRYGLQEFGGPLPVATPSS